jgi:hypothetical protein
VAKPHFKGSDLPCTFGQRFTSRRSCCRFNTLPVNIHRHGQEVTLIGAQGLCCFYCPLSNLRGTWLQLMIDDPHMYWSKRRFLTRLQSQVDKCERIWTTGAANQQRNARKASGVLIQSTPDAFTWLNHGLTDQGASTRITLE